ncbi:hypothetical protein PIROE2DRAFT_61332 [Piromyces sp. E2]|nr:hypothetical protein PIROE2DRAFT_61332 [Piromyces sp. E2]|eukprot:OUM63348.1 hypothetical protein PIROE2DRAFT_61332 [Piromyces sp. E2]
MDTDKIFISGDVGSKDLYVHNNSIFTIFFEGYAVNYDDSWILENVEELKNTDVTPLELYKTSWGDEPNSGMYYLTGNKNRSGYSIFNFQINNSTMENLPQLKFAFMRVGGNSNKVTVNLLPAKTEEPEYADEKLNDLSFYLPEEDDIYIEEYGGERSLEIEDGKIFKVILNGKLSDDVTLKSPNSWFFDSESIGEQKDLIELVSTCSRYNNYYSNSEYVFKFKVNKINENTVLPALLFSYKKSEEESSKISATVILTKKGEHSYYFKYYRNLRQRLYTKNNEIVSVALLSDPYIGNIWYLANEEEVKKSDFLELIKLNEEEVAPFVSYGTTPDGSVGSFMYKFRIKENAEGEFILKFNEAKDKSGSEILHAAQLTLEIKGKQLDEILPVIAYEPNRDQVVYVESNTVLTISEYSNSSTGYQWFHVNKDEIEKSEVIDYIGSSFESNCQPDHYGKMPIGCGGTEVFKYHIKEVTDEKQLPQIKLTYARVLEVMIVYN